MDEKVEGILSSPWIVPAAIGVIGFGSGLGLGFFLGKRKADPDDGLVYETIDGSTLEFEFEDVEVTFAPAPDETTPERPPKVVIDEEVAVDKGILTVDSLSDLRPSMVSEEAVEEEPVKAVVEVEEVIVTPQEELDIEWDYEEEIEKRTETAPYILHKEEFYADEKNYTQSSLTYFAVDETLADEDNRPIYNHSAVTGPLLFGHGSGQEDVVYIRNDERRAEYEVTRVEGRYTIEVLGYELEHDAEVEDIKHSKHMKFRMD
jgi:hypothetical protein